MQIELTEQIFNPWERIQHHEEKKISSHECGAVATFIGKMRNHNEGDQVSQLFLEHYPGMTENYLTSIGQTALQRWKIPDILIIHRIGLITPGETIVLVATWSSHRAEALAACRFLIEELKSQAPFWKKETTNKGQRWVTHNTPGTIEVNT